MRTSPSDESDQKELERLNVEPWMVELLGINPSYTSWGPDEDYMWRDDQSWAGRMIVDSWKKNQIDLDDLNEVVNFYFSVHRDNRSCENCGGSGYHPHASWVADSFYSHSSPFKEPTRRELESMEVLSKFGSSRGGPLEGYNAFPDDAVLLQYGDQFRAFCEEMRNGDGCWHDKITQDELDALKANRRCKDHETLDQVNSSERGRGLGHDAINRWILIKARLKRFEIPQGCPVCDAHGYVYTADRGHVKLTLWLLHPRKGASRGVRYELIEQDDLSSIRMFLQEAAERNASRFSRVLEIGQ